MSKYIYIRNRNLPIKPQSKFDYGCYLKLRRDNELVSKTFGGLDKFVTNDGKIGMYTNDDVYTFNGDINYHLDKIPLSLKPDAEEISSKFIDDLIQDISVRVGKKVSELNRDSCNKHLRNTNNKFDPIKKEIVWAIIEVARNYKLKGYDLKNDPNFNNSYIFNTKTYKFINNVSKSLKVYFDKEKDRYKINVSPFKKSEQFQVKKRNHFRDLSKEKLNLLFPKSDRFNWITKDKAKITEEKTELVYGEEDIYEAGVSKNLSTSEKSKITLKNIFNGNKEFEKTINSYSENNVMYDIIYIINENKNIEFIDNGRTFKDANGVIVFKKIGSDEKNFRYENKNLYINDKLLGKFKYLKNTNENTGRYIHVFIKKVV